MKRLLNRTATKFVVFMVLARVAHVDAQDAREKSGLATIRMNARGGDQSGDINVLRSRIEQLEDAAAKLAREIRNRSNSGQDEKQAKLKQLIGEAFELKLQLEELQVAALKARLKRFEEQIQERKQLREKIIEHRIDQLIDQSRIRWNVTDATGDSELTAAESKSAESAKALTPATSDSDASASQPDASTALDAPPEWLAKFRTQLEPVAKRLAAAKGKVRELEAVYFRDRSRVEELRHAMEELTKAGDDVKGVYDSFENDYSKLVESRIEANRVFKLINKRFEEMNSNAKEVLEDPAGLKKFQQTLESSAKKLHAIKELESDYLRIISTLVPDGSSQAVSLKPVVGSSRFTYQKDVARAWLQYLIGVKLQPEPCGELKLAYPMAFRVQSSNHLCDAGDLIVGINSHAFDSWETAFSAMLESLPVGVVRGSTDRTNYRLEYELMYIKRGLSGPVISSRVLSGVNCADLEPNPFADGSTVKLEFRIRIGDGGQVETKYVKGVCLSPEGLVVAPIVRTSLADEEILIVDKPHTAVENRRCRLVAADEQHGLALVRLNMVQNNGSPSSPMGWQKCRSQMPLRNQLVTIPSMGGEIRILGVGQWYPKPFAAKDAFVVSIHGKISPSDSEGTPLVALDDTLQGMVVALHSEPDVNSPREQREQEYQYLAIPAIHADKLLNDYWRSLEK